MHQTQNPLLIKKTFLSSNKSGGLMKKNLICVLCILMLTALLVACGKKEEQKQETVNNDPAILGTWTESYFDSGYTFHEDTTGVEIFFDQAFTYTAVDGVLTIHYEQTDVPYADKEFTYTISDNTLTLERAAITNADGSIASEAQTFTYTKAQ